MFPAPQANTVYQPLQYHFLCQWYNSARESAKQSLCFLLPRLTLSTSHYSTIFYVNGIIQPGKALNNPYVACSPGPVPQANTVLATTVPFSMSMVSFLVLLPRLTLSVPATTVPFSTSMVSFLVNPCVSCSPGPAPKAKALLLSFQGSGHGGTAEGDLFYAMDISPWVTHGKSRRANDPECSTSCSTIFCCFSSGISGVKHDSSNVFVSWSKMI